MTREEFDRLQMKIGKSNAMIIRKFFGSSECHNDSTGKVEDVEAIIETRDNCLLGFFKGKAYQSLNALYLKSEGNELHLQDCSSGGTIGGELLTIANVLEYNKSMILRCDNIRRVYFHDSSVWEIDRDTVTIRTVNDIEVS